jgi:hypothetical protein
MKRIIYSYFINDERAFFIDHLREKRQWEPVFFLGSEHQRPWIKTNYPDAVLQD